MGTAHARQQLASRGSNGASLGAGVALAPLVGGPSPTDAVSSAMPTDGGQDERIPVVFTWTHGGQNVFLAASFNAWQNPIPMVRSGNEFSVVHELPKGVHQYKFIVDDQWRFATDQPKTQDAHGNMNNVLDISGYHRFQAGQFEREAPPLFAQHIPDPNDYTLDAPVIPIMLLKSPFCALPPRPEITGYQPLSIQTHALCDHIYIKERPDEAAPTIVAVTHRYNQKYSTTVFATRGAFARESAGTPNLLKAAVRRTRTKG